VATFDRLFAANVRAPYFLVAALAPKMAARGNGSIINGSLVFALVGTNMGGGKVRRVLEPHPRGSCARSQVLTLSNQHNHQRRTPLI
jgi:NAD(P)-dependent dehydrogenase (short-subunit alcohol dehydrogenase family)